MGKHVILHKFGTATIKNVDGSETEVKVLEDSGTFDPDAEDNPDWVTEALANRETGTSDEEGKLAAWSDPVSAPQPASVFETQEFGPETSYPEGVDVPEENDEVIADENPEPAATLARVEFGVEPPADDEDGEKTSRRSRRSAAKKDEEKDTSSDS